MAVKMRLRRMGNRNAPFYRVVVQDSRRAPTGRFIESIGWYDPKQQGDNFSIKLDRVNYWVKNGAQASDTVASLIKKAKLGSVEDLSSGVITSNEVSQEAIELETAEDNTIDVKESNNNENMISDKEPTLESIESESEKSNE